MNKFSNTQENDKAVNPYALQESTILYLLIYKNEIDFYKLKEKTGNKIIFL